MAASAVSSPQPLAFEPLDYFQLPPTQVEPRLSPTQYVLNQYSQPAYSESVESALPQWSTSFSASINPTALNQRAQLVLGAMNPLNTSNSLGLISDLVTSSTGSWNSWAVTSPLHPSSVRPYGCPITDASELHTEALPSAIDSTQLVATLLPLDQCGASGKLSNGIASDHITSPEDQFWSDQSDIDWQSFLSQDALSLTTTNSDAGDLELASTQQSVTESEQLPSNRPLFHQFAVNDSKIGSKANRYKIQGSRTKYSKGKPDGMFQTWTLKEKSKKPKTAEAKKKTALNRQLGACPYHQRKKKACDPSCMPYIRCMKSIEPMFMIKIDEIRLFRRGPSTGHPLESARFEVFELKDLQGSEAYSYGLTPVTITQDLGPELEVLVAPFSPKLADKTSHIWFQGDNRREISMTPYCLADLPRLRQSLLEYITSSVGLYLQNVTERAEPLTRSFLLHAHHFAITEHSSLVQGALHLLAVNRMIEYDWRINGSETLGHSPNFEPGCPWFGKVPVTPMMDTQLDQIIINDFLNPLRRKVLEELQQKMYSAAKESFYEIFLAVFILATNTQLLLRHSRNNAARYRAKSRYNSLSLAKEYVHGHNILLAHFHFFCFGSPLAPNFPSSKVNESVSLSVDQINFIQHVKSFMGTENVRRLRDSKYYESELYWSHQLFVKNWIPESKEIAMVTS